MASSTTKTKAVVALGLLDVARQVAHAWSAKQRAEEERIGFGKGLRQDALQLARDTRDRLPDAPRIEWGYPPSIRRQPTTADRIREWAPMAMIVGASTAAVIVAAHIITKHDEQTAPGDVATDSKMVGAVRASSKAIDAGMSKVVDGGSAAAQGTAATVAAGSTAIKQIAVKRAKDELDERVVQPAKQKAVFYGGLGFVALTVWVVFIAVIVQLVVGALT